MKYLLLSQENISDALALPGSSAQIWFYSFVELELIHVTKAPDTTGKGLVEKPPEVETIGVK